MGPSSGSTTRACKVPVRGWRKKCCVKDSWGSCTEPGVGRSQGCVRGYLELTRIKIQPDIER
eukprot:scaffold171027_cov18-Tisochrysis_lutea.AAC.1